MEGTKNWKRAFRNFRFDLLQTNCMDECSSFKSSKIPADILIFLIEVERRVQQIFMRHVRSEACLRRMGRFLKIRHSPTIHSKTKR